MDGWAEDRAACEALRAGVREALGGFHDDHLTIVGNLTSPARLRHGREALAFGPIL